MLTLLPRDPATRGPFIRDLTRTAPPAGDMLNARRRHGKGYARDGISSRSV
jgi:hypothetical protein